MLKKIYGKVSGIYNQAVFPYTRASLKKKIVFIHIPKAAGTAVRVALGEPETGRRHLPWWVYQQASPKKFEEFYKFAFVRNPIDRVLSGYNYLRSGGNQMGDISVAKYLSRYNSFHDFIKFELLTGSMIYHPIFCPQSWYLCDWQGEIKVDFLGKFETINKDFENIAQAIGLANFDRLPVINKSLRKADLVDDDSKRRIFDIYKHDFEMFGY